MPFRFAVHVAVALLFAVAALPAVGFAQQPSNLHRSDHGVEVPPGVDIRALAEQFAGRFAYDAEDKVLLWRGRMTEIERDKLIAAGNGDAAWTAAIRAIFDSAQPRAELAPAAEDQVFSLFTQNMDAVELLSLIGIRYELNIVVGNGIAGTPVTIALRNVPLSHALNVIVKTIGCRIVRETDAAGKEIVRVVKVPASETYSPADVAGILDVDVTAILAAIEAGELTAARIGDDARITRRDLNIWLRRIGSKGLDADEDAGDSDENDGTGD